MVRGLEIRKKVYELAKPIVEKKGLILLDVESEIHGRNCVLRIYLHKPGGRVNLRDCEQVSREVELKLDQDLSIDIPYVLEVSTPGIFRKLKDKKEYGYFEGLRVHVNWNDEDGKAREVVGIISKAGDCNVTLDVGEEGLITIAHDRITNANLEPEI